MQVSLNFKIGGYKSYLLLEHAKKEMQLGSFVFMGLGSLNYNTAILNSKCDLKICIL